uniref:Leucine rich repeat containing 34 n=1 Tax=Sinocyclocheilus rhinocerous TaxID=307959 RepID=A0A673M650_9TELE
MKEYKTEHFRYSLTIYYKKNLLSLLQMDAMTEVLSNSDEVEQLILRNTGLTDELLKSLATVLKRSPSEVTVINLNLNQIGPPGVNVLLDLLQAKPQIKELLYVSSDFTELLFGNQLGDLGVQTLLSGLAELQDKTAALVLATFMRYHSHLQYLGLAQTPCSDMEAWKVLFESLKMNTALTHIILDESNLGDNVIKLFAEALRSNKTLRKVDLDNNCFGEVGGHYLLEALRSGGKCSLEHLSLEVNYISTALMANIQQELESNIPSLLLLAQLVNENKDIIKGKFGVGITFKTEDDTFIKANYHQIFLKCLRSEADCRQQPF